MAKLLLTLSALVALAAFAAASVYPDHEPRDVWHNRINGNIDKVSVVLKVFKKDNMVSSLFIGSQALVKDSCPPEGSPKVVEAEDSGQPDQAELPHG